jgi:hypothetical protein
LFYAGFSGDVSALEFCYKKAATHKNNKIDMMDYTVFHCVSGSFLSIQKAYEYNLAGN